ncbi:hypothetical protein LXJ58_31035, partial [Escherichia coli]|nr:hypothetical protein [Escherichia coli]
MPPRFVQRLSGALVIALVAAAAVYTVGASIDDAAVTLVGGIAAGLAAMGIRSAAPAASGPVAPDVDRVLDEVLDGIAEPVLLVRGKRVSCANQAARSLLGRHIVDEDIRIAIRHPAAADRLAGDAPLPGRPIELVGLG